MKPVRAAVAAPDNLWTEISSHPNVDWVRVNEFGGLEAVSEADACFYLYENASELPTSVCSKPLFIHSVCEKISDLPIQGEVCRINAWPGFLSGKVWELAGAVTEGHRKFMDSAGKEFVITADEPGFVSARVLSMIINEAYFAAGENVSSREDIDTALKLGTNYPFGPFEWANRIGAGKVYNLLHTLSRTDPVYTPSPLLTREAGEN